MMGYGERASVFRKEQVWKRYVYIKMLRRRSVYVRRREKEEMLEERGFHGSTRGEAF